MGGKLPQGLSHHTWNLKGIKVETNLEMHIHHLAKRVDAIEISVTVPVRLQLVSMGVPLPIIHAATLAFNISFHKIPSKKTL